MVEHSEVQKLVEKARAGDREAFADVADGLQHAHSKGVIHRDIKPSNLILDAERRLRILDFGLARLEGQESLTVSGDLVGTPLYMSPEQARQRKVQIDHRTDIYSLGATMYEMLAWRPPFRGKDHPDTLSQIIERDPVEPRKLNPRVPRNLETIVLKCLRKDPGDRFGTAEVLAQDLSRFVRGDPIEAQRQALWERLGRRVRVNLGKILTTSAVVALLFVAGTTGLLQLRDKRAREIARYETEILPSYLSFQLPSLLAEREDMVRLGPGSRDTAGLIGLTDLRGVLRRVQRTLDDLLLLQKLLPRRPEAYYQRARALLLLGRRPEAIRELNEALSRDDAFLPARILGDEMQRSTGETGHGRADIPEWALTWLKAYRAVKRGDHVASAQLYTALIEHTETGEEMYPSLWLEARLARGRAWLALGDVRAISDFEVIRTRWPDALEPILLEGRALHELGYPGLAEELFDRCYRKTPFREDAALWIFQLYRQLADFERAEQWRAKIEPESLRERLHALLLRDSGDPQGAREAAERAVRLDPMNAKNHEALLLILDLLDPQAQGQALEQALRLHPDDKRLRHWSAFLHFREQRHLEAVKISHEILRIEPGLWRVEETLGLSLFRLGRVDDALERLRKLARENSVYNRASLGWALFNLGRLEEAREAYEYTAQRNPNRCPWAYRLLGMIHERLGDSKRAEEYFQRALTAYPRSLRPHYNYATFLEHQGRFEPTFEHYAAAYGFDPGQEILQFRLSGVLQRSASGELSARSLARFVTELEALRDSNPQNALIRHLLALTLIRLPESELERAFELASSELDHAGGDAAALLTTLGEIQWRHGQRADAIRSLERALEAPRPTRWTQALLDRYRAVAGHDLRKTTMVSSELSASIPLRINCGGGDYADHSGVTWFADRFFQGG